MLIVVNLSLTACSPSSCLTLTNRAFRDPFSLFDAFSRDDPFFHGLQPLLKRATTGPAAMSAVASFKVDISEVGRG